MFGLRFLDGGCGPGRRFPPEVAFEAVGVGLQLGQQDGLLGADLANRIGEAMPRPSRPGDLREGRERRSNLVTQAADAGDDGQLARDAMPDRPVETAASLTKELVEIDVAHGTPALRAEPFAVTRAIAHQIDRNFIEHKRCGPRPKAGDGSCIEARPEFDDTTEIQVKSLRLGRRSRAQSNGGFRHGGRPDFEVS